jgi:hypothetical protein
MSQPTCVMCLEYSNEENIQQIDLNLLKCKLFTLKFAFGEYFDIMLHLQLCSLLIIFFFNANNKICFLKLLHYNDAVFLLDH